MPVMFMLQIIFNLNSW